MNKEYTDDRLQGIFAAANSGEGFSGFYPQIFGNSDIVRRYLIKGGPGTGKSSFMRRVADAAESRGYAVEYYRCSSDHTSLDAIVIDKHIALIDATAPHVLEPELAGAKDEILNLGEFWDSRALFKSRERISELSLKKSEAYKGAYRFLAAALSIDKRSRELSGRFVDYAKLERAVARIMAKLPGGSGYEQSIGICNSVGMKGRIRLSYYENTAERIYVLQDHMCTAHLFLANIVNESVKKGNRIRVSFDPVNLSCLDAVYFEDTRTAFIVCDERMLGDNADKIVGRVNMKRFIHPKGAHKEQKQELRSDRRTYDGLLDSAVNCLRKAGEAHFELEEIYGSCMDFEAENRFCQSFILQICDELEEL